MYVTPFRFFIVFFFFFLVCEVSYSFVLNASTSHLVVRFKVFHYLTICFLPDLIFRYFSKGLFKPILFRVSSVLFGAKISCSSTLSLPLFLCLSKIPLLPFIRTSLEKLKAYMFNKTSPDILGYTDLSCSLTVTTRASSHYCFSLLLFHN